MTQNNDSTEIIEQSVIGGFIRLPHLLADTDLNPEDFLFVRNQVIFAAIRSLDSRNKDIDALTVSEELERTGQLERVGMAHVASLVIDTISDANLLNHARMVKDRSLRRQLASIAADIASTTAEGDVLDLIDKAQGRIMSLNQADEKDVVPVSSLLVGFYEELKRRRNSENKLLGLSTGINALDKILNGLQPGSLYVVAGRPSMGKSVVGFHFALQAALNGTAALMESLEMSQQELLFRAVAGMGRIPLGRLLNADLNVEEWGWVRDTLRTLHNSPLFIAEQSGLTVSTLRRKARGLKKKKNLGLIVVDYLQLMRGDTKEGRTREIGGMSNALKCLAKELHVPVVVLSQLNRGLENRDDKRPVQSDLRDSGEIEQDADVILAIYRDEVYNPETVDAGFMEIIVRKQRQGQLGTVPVRFEGDFVRISGLTSETGGLPSWNMPKEEQKPMRTRGAPHMRSRNAGED